MGTYAKDERVIDAVTATSISSSLSNDFEDQVRGMVKGLYTVAPLSAAQFDISAGATDWYFKVGNDPPYWSRNGSHAHPLQLSVGALREGQKIEAAYVWIYGDTAGGSIKLYKNKLDTTPSTRVSVGDAGTDPWNQGGAYALLTLTLTPEALDAYTGYHFLFTTPASGTMRVLGAALKIAFGDYT